MILRSLLTLITGLVLASPAMAQAEETPTGSGANSLQRIIDAVNSVLDGLKTLFIGELAGGIVALMVIIGGIQYITGNKDGGKKTIMAALVGAAIIILAYGIVSLVQMIN